MSIEFQTHYITECYIKLEQGTFTVQKVKIWAVLFLCEKARFKQLLFKAIIHAKHYFVLVA